MQHRDEGDAASKATRPQDSEVQQRINVSRFNAQRES
jgi:hypothetical protein